MNNLKDVVKTLNSIPEFEYDTNRYLSQVVRKELSFLLEIEDYGSYEVVGDENEIVVTRILGKDLYINTKNDLIKFIREIDNVTHIRVAPKFFNGEEKFYMYMDGELYTRFGVHSGESVTITMEEFVLDAQVRIASRKGFLYWVN